MPVAKQELPTALRPFAFQGLDLSYREGDDEARADCPFCGREGKLYANAADGRWNCRVCSESGNVYGLFRRLWETGVEEGERLDSLAASKRLTPEGLRAWGVRLNPVSGEVVCPGFDPNGKLNQLYRWTWSAVEKRWYWMLAKGTNHWVHGVHLFDPDKPDVYVCEGLWDGVALWEFMRSHYRTENGVCVPTEDESESLLATANVVAVPSATTFNEQWSALFAGKRVHFLYDNDHPDRQGRLSALEGTKLAVNVLVWADEPPELMQWLVWGRDEGYDPGLPHRYDVRDLLTLDSDGTGTLPPEELTGRAERLFSSLQPVPAEWVEGAKKKGKPLVEPIECKRWDTLVDVCSKALAFHEGMSRALAVMLAAAASVEIGLDQLWVKFIGPPSSGKTTLADGLLVARRYATSINVVTGLHSGYKEAKEGDEPDKDHSLMTRVRGKAAIIKDGDTLRQAENRAKLLADLRDAYDRKTSVHFRNGINREYDDWSWVLLIYGTDSLRDIDASEVGQRFIDCVVMDGVDEDVEDDILEQKKRRYRQVIGSQSTLNGDKTEGKLLTTAKRMIGGYLIHLRQNMKYLVEDVERKTPDKALDEMKGYAKLVAVFRARPSTSQSENETREIAGRLYDQMMKLGTCLAATMNRESIDAEVLKIVKRTALDTCRGKTLLLARTIHKAGSGGIDVTSLSVKCSMPGHECKSLLTFLKKIEVLDLTAAKGKVGLGAASNRWKLTAKASKLYKKVLS